MVGHPCNRADSTPTAHIWQVAVKQRTGPTGLSPPARCLYPQPNDASKNSMLESRNDPSVHKFICLPHCNGSAYLRGWGGWGQSLSVSPFCQPLLHNHSWKIPKRISLKSLGNISWQIKQNLLIVSRSLDHPKPKLHQIFYLRLILLGCLATEALGRALRK